MWAQVVKPPVIAPRELASYPLMLRTSTYAWWRPVVGVVLVLVGVLMVVPALLTPVVAVAVSVEGGQGPFAGRVSAAMQGHEVTPAAMLYLNLTLASLTLVTMLVVRWVHGLSPRCLASVLPGTRWRFFIVCLGLAVIALVVSQLVQAALPDAGSGTGGEAAVPTGQLLATACVILVTTPLQALGEEYGFRGYLMQAFGSLSCSRAAALLITALLFGLAHGVQNVPLFLDRFAFGLMAGFAVILIGGLEAGIALHIVNNLVAFGIAITYNQLGEALNVTEVSWWQIPVTVVQNGVFLLLVWVVARHLRLPNRTASQSGQAV